MGNSGEIDPRVLTPNPSPWDAGGIQPQTAEQMNLVLGFHQGRGDCQTKGRFHHCHATVQGEEPISGFSRDIPVENPCTFGIPHKVRSEGTWWCLKEAAPGDSGIFPFPCTPDSSCVSHSCVFSVGPNDPKGLLQP